MNTKTNARLLSWVVLLPVALLSQARLNAQSDNPPAPVASPPTAEAPKDAPKDAPSAAPQSPQQTSAEPQSNVVIRKETRLVLVDTVVTNKKGEYVRDLKQSDFKVYEDNKEQAISTFSTGSDPAIQASGQKRYLILFFDNSTMQPPDQIQARNAANQFIAANSDADHLMAVVDFGGALRIVQNFTANADLLRSAVGGVKFSSINPNANVPDSQPVTVASTGLSSLSNAEADFGARSVLLAVRSLAKNLRTVPGRKMLVLFSGGFALNPENQSSLTATIDACNKSNVAIYALDARGLVGGAPGGSARLHTADGLSELAKNTAGERSITDTPRTQNARTAMPRIGTPQLMLASFSASAEPDPQRPGGGGGTGGVAARVALAADVAGRAVLVAPVEPAEGEEPEAPEQPAAPEERAAPEEPGQPEALAERELPGELQAAPVQAQDAPEELATPALTISILRTTSRAPSFRHFPSRPPPTSKSWRCWPKALAVSLSSTPTIFLADCSASAASKVSFMFWDMCPTTRRKAHATR